MAICAVCHAPCWSKCVRCGASLCATHRPASSRAKCAICKRVRTGVAQAVQAIPAYPVYSAPARLAALPATPLPQSTVPLAILTLADQLAWISIRRTQLRQKQQRERAYLDRRAARGAHTPTDDAYEADAILEDDLLEALDLLEDCLQSGSPAPGAASTNDTYAGDTSFLFPDPGLHAKP
jgi:hypothetical protein